MEKIPFKDYSYATDMLGSVDDQVYINHDHCTSGRDTRGRLSVKRIGVSAYIAHCFNCGLSGYHFGGGVVRARETAEQRESTSRHDNSMTGYNRIMDHTTDALPLHVEEYLLKYHVTKKEAVEVLQYSYSKKTDSLIMPLYQDATGVTAEDRIQTRYMGEERGSARYKTYSKHAGTTPNAMFGLVSGRGRGRGISINDTVVIVEDQISAYRVHRDSDYKIDALALLGTNMGAEVISCLEARKHKKVLVWLDNDVAGRKVSPEIVKTLKPILNIPVGWVDYVQPKSQTVEALQRILEIYG